MEGYNYTEQDENTYENQVTLFLELPKKRDFENLDRQVAQDLGVFLVNNSFIKNIGVWKGSWGFKYNSKNKTIFI